MTGAIRALTFPILDGLAFAAVRGRLSVSEPSEVFEARELGPAIELIQLSADGLLPNLTKLPRVRLDGLSTLHEAIEEQRTSWISENGSIGFMRTVPDLDQDEALRFELRLAAQRAASRV